MNRSRTMVEGAEHLYVNLGRARELSGEWAKARDAYEELREHGKRRREPKLEVIALNRLAILSAQQDFDMPAAVALLEEALRVTEGVGDAAMVAETEWNLSQMHSFALEGPKAIAHGERALGIARGLSLDELEARCLTTLATAYSAAGRYGEASTHARDGAALYATLDERPEPKAGALSAQYMWAGSPPSVAASYRAMRSQCLCLVAVSEVNLGEVRAGIEAGREAVEIGREVRSGFALAHGLTNLTHGLTEAGEYAEALRATREGLEVARGLSSSLMLIFLLTVRGNLLQALLRLDQARAAYEEALALIEATSSRRWSSVVVPKLCANRARAGDWEVALRYALRAKKIREEMPARLIWMDFERHLEIEALLRAGDVELAREDTQELDERVGQNRRHRLVHLRMLAVLARWDGAYEDAVEHLREAETLSEEMGLPGELWQVRAALGVLYRERGEREEAQKAFDRAAEVVTALARNIGDEDLRAGFLGADPVRRVLGR